MRTFEVSYFVPSVTTKGFQEAEMLTAHDGLCASITNYDFNVYFWDEKLGKQKENYPNFLKIPINMFFLLKRGVWERGGGNACKIGQRTARVNNLCTLLCRRETKQHSRLLHCH